MKPRGFFATWVILFSITALPFGLIASLIFGKDNIVLCMIGGFLFGTFFGLCMAPFKMAVKRTLQYKGKNDFLRKLYVVAAEVGYHPQSQIGDFIVFESAGANLKIGPLSITPASFFTISIQLDNKSAAVVGPRADVKQLVKHLNL